MDNQNNLENSKKLKTKAILIILGILVLFFTSTFLIGNYAGKELASELQGPLALIFGGVVIFVTLFFNKKIEGPKK